MSAKSSSEPKTIAEKIFESHLVEKAFDQAWVLSLDAVFCHEITTPIAIQDLIDRGMDRVFDPSKIKAVIDHVTPAKDSKTAQQGKVLRDWAHRHKIKDFFDIGANGVCHALFPEKGFVRPGYTIIMGDSHTCTHGAFGAFAAGVGTTDLEVGILKGVCAFRYPKTIRFDLQGKRAAGVTAKDVILTIIGKIGVAGATDCVMEFTGPGVHEMTMEERMTLCNMAIEAGGTSGICYPDEVTLEYLWPFIGPNASANNGEKRYQNKAEALADFKKWHSDPGANYQEEHTIDLSTIEPVSTFGFKPDQVKTLSELEGTKVDQIYIGSCTNGRLSDLQEAAEVLKGNQLAHGVRGIVSPATPLVYRQAMEDGTLQVFLDAGFCVTNPTCGACLGMSNGVLAEGEVCASTTNRNFFGRMGKGGTVHLMSPASAAKAAITGTISPLA